MSRVEIDAVSASVSEFTKQRNNFGPPGIVDFQIYVRGFWYGKRNGG